MAYGNFMWWWEWPDAERDFLRAIQLNANYLPAHHWYALYLAAMGRQRESIEQIRLAQELDPKSLIVQTASGYVYYFARQNDAAIEECKAALATDHSFMVAHYVLGLAYEAKQDYPHAIEEFQKAVDISGRVPNYLAAMGHSYAVSGNRQGAEAILAELTARAAQQYVSPSAQATVWAGLGEKTQAITWMKRASQGNDAALIWIRVDPRWDVLRPDPWFQDELQRHPAPGEASGHELKP
jgi:tetratricopeptide (TPR) repeat protein